MVDLAALNFYLDLMIVKVFSNLNYSMIPRHADDTMLGTPASMLTCRTAIQRDRDRLEEWANGTLIKFSEGKVLKVCTCKETTPSNDTAWGLPGWSSSLEEALEMLVGSTQAAERATTLLMCISRGTVTQLKEGIISLCRALGSPSGHFSHFGPPCTTKVQI